MVSLLVIAGVGVGVEVDTSHLHGSFSIHTLIDRSGEPFGYLYILVSFSRCNIVGCN